MIGGMISSASPGSLLTIGEFARLTRLTTKALRIYDKSGLLHPKHVDPMNGYRRYSLEQAHSARLIGLLRATNLALAEIALLLADVDSDPTDTCDISKASTRADDCWSVTSTPSSPERTRRCSRSRPATSLRNE
jgi:DNA-binding transcriptional MerR regulator